MKNILTTLEFQLTELVSKGLSNKEIAKEMSISVHTVKSHLENIFFKLGINNRVLLAVMFTKSQFI